MAERRMFAKSVIGSDSFAIDLPMSAQCLYFHLAMEADDDGFIDSPKRIMRSLGHSDEDLRLLIEKSFLIRFDSGVLVVTHWQVHNTIQKDRYHETAHLKERSELTVKNRVYTLCIQDGYKMDTEIREEEDSEKKESEDEGSAPAPAQTTPTLAEVRAFVTDQGIKIDPDRFFNFYESKGWADRGSPILDWRSRARSWESLDKKWLADRQQNPKKNSFLDFNQRKPGDPDYKDLDEIIFREKHGPRKPEYGG